MRSFESTDSFLEYDYFNNINFANPLYIGGLAIFYDFFLQCSILEVFHHIG